MDFFFILFIIGFIVLIKTRFNQMTDEVATIHCLQHKWVLDENREMYCVNCKKKPE